MACFADEHTARDAFRLPFLSKRIQGWLDIASGLLLLVQRLRALSLCTQDNDVRASLLIRTCSH
jgi:hypothetical protein